MQKGVDGALPTNLLDWAEEERTVCDRIRLNYEVNQKHDTVEQLKKQD